MLELTLSSWTPVKAGFCARFHPFAWLDCTDESSGTDYNGKFANYILFNSFSRLIKKFGTLHYRSVEMESSVDRLLIISAKYVETDQEGDFRPGSHLWQHSNLSASSRFDRSWCRRSSSWHGIRINLYDSRGLLLDQRSWVCFLLLLQPLH